MRRVILVGAAFLSACGSTDTSESANSDVAKVAKPEADCSSIRDQVVAATQDADVKILKIYNPEEISKSKKLLSCKGSAALSTGDGRQPVYYKLETDEEGEKFIGYSPAPYTNAAK